MPNTDFLPFEIILTSKNILLKEFCYHASRVVSIKRPPKQDKMTQSVQLKKRKQYTRLSLLPFQQFQALFNSLFKVLCIFPSRYLFAIGLPPIFSLRCELTTHFELQSQATRLFEIKLIKKIIKLSSKLL